MRIRIQGGKATRKFKKTVLGNIRSVFFCFYPLCGLVDPDPQFRMDPELSPGSGIIVLDPDPANIKEEINKIKKILGKGRSILDCVCLL